MKLLFAATLLAALAAASAYVPCGDDGYVCYKEKNNKESCYCDENAGNSGTVSDNYCTNLDSELINDCGVCPTPLKGAVEDAC